MGVGGWVQAWFLSRANQQLQREMGELQRRQQQDVAELQQQWQSEAAELQQQWAKAFQAAEWVVSSDIRRQRLGIMHLRQMLITDATDEEVRAYVRTTFQAALAVTLPQAGQHDVTVVQLPNTPPPTLPALEFNPTRTYSRDTEVQSMSEPKVLLVSDADIDMARTIVEIDRIEGRQTDDATLRIANATSARSSDTDTLGENFVWFPEKVASAREDKKPYGTVLVGGGNKHLPGFIVVQPTGVSVQVTDAVDVPSILYVKAPRRAHSLTQTRHGARS